MSDLPLSVVLSVLVHDNRILLIKRAGGDFSGMWAIPGGKIEGDEHISDAATREILEESGLDSEFRKNLATVSEHILEGEEIKKHFLLHVCELVPKSFDLKSSNEGEIKWFDMDGLEEMKDMIVPSDFLMIEKIVKNRESNYYNSVIEKSGEKYILRKFE